MPRALLPAAVLVAAAMCVVSAFGLAGLAFGHTEERSRTVTGPVTSVVVDGASGDVALMAADVDDVTIHERRHYGWRKPHVRVALRDGVLRVSVRCRSFSGGCGDDLDIVVPRGVRGAVVRSGSGDVSLAGLAGGTFTAATASGDVRANRISGTVSLRSASGDVEAGDVRGAVELHTSSGDVSGHRLDAAEIHARTGSGDVDLHVPGGRYRLDTSTGSGDEHVSGVARDDLAARTIVARTGSGDVSVRGS